MNDEFQYQTLVTNIIPEVTEVRFYSETLAHIVEEHPEFAGQLPSVLSSIQNTIYEPTIIFRSQHKTSNSYVFCSYSNTFWNSPMHVPVKIIEGTSGLLKTAYFSDVGKGEIVWRKD